jgi:hypothetical protein
MNLNLRQANFFSSHRSMQYNEPHFVLYRYFCSPVSYAFNEQQEMVLFKKNPLKWISEPC